MPVDPNKYPKQPVNPQRTPSQSVTWVRNLEKVQKRKVVVVPNPAYRPRPAPKPGK